MVRPDDLIRWLTRCLLRVARCEWMALEYCQPGLLGPEEPEYVLRRGAQKPVEGYFLFPC
jgi:hypothetical protein